MQTLSYYLQFNFLRHYFQGHRKEKDKKKMYIIQPTILALYEIDVTWCESILQLLSWIG